MLLRMIKKLLGIATLALAAEGCSYNQPDSIKNSYDNKYIKQDKLEQEKEQAEEDKAKKIKVGAIHLRRDILFRIADKTYSTHFTEDELKEFNSRYGQLVKLALETKTIFKDDEEILLAGGTIKRCYNDYMDYKNTPKENKELYKKSIEDISAKEDLLKTSIEETKKRLQDKKNIEDKIKDEPKKPGKNEGFTLEELENKYIKGADIYVSWLAFKDVVRDYSQNSKLSKDEKRLMIGAAIDEFIGHYQALSKKEIDRNKDDLKENELSELEKKLKERNEVLEKLTRSFSQKVLEK